jgi:hypothetical protein
VDKDKKQKKKTGISKNPLFTKTEELTSDSSSQFQEENTSMPLPQYTGEPASQHPSLPAQQQNTTPASQPAGIPVSQQASKIKATFYLHPSQIKALEEIKFKLSQKYNIKVDKSFLVRFALKSLINEFEEKEQESLLIKSLKK